LSFKDVLTSAEGGVFGFALVAFCFVHYSLIFTNKTTIESMQEHRYRFHEGVESTPVTTVNVFDLGYCENWVKSGNCDDRHQTDVDLFLSI
jgi:hypothetical protein